METIKLVANMAFYDRVGKRIIPQGVMFYADSERAVSLVSGGFANIVERPKKPEVIVEDNKIIPTVKEKPLAKSVVKRVAKRKQVKK